MPSIRIKSSGVHPPSGVLVMDREIWMIDSKGSFVSKCQRSLSFSAREFWFYFLAKGAAIRMIKEVGGDTVSLRGCLMGQRSAGCNGVRNPGKGQLVVNALARSPTSRKLFPALEKAGWNLWTGKKWLLRFGRHALKLHPQSNQRIPGASCADENKSVGMGASTVKETCLGSMSTLGDKLRVPLKRIIAWSSRCGAVVNESD